MDNWTWLGSSVPWLRFRYHWQAIHHCRKDFGRVLSQGYKQCGRWDPVARDEGKGFSQRISFGHRDALIYIHMLTYMYLHGQRMQIQIYMYLHIFISLYISMYVHTWIDSQAYTTVIYLVEDMCCDITVWCVTLILVPVVSAWSGFHWSFCSDKVKWRSRCPSMRPHWPWSF